MGKELRYLKGAVDERERPMCAIIGGAKVSKRRGEANDGFANM